MNVSKIKIKNLFGITEKELDGKSVELSGQNGIGKSSVLDAIRYALTNNSNRDYIVKNGENEGEIYIETNTGLTINRKKRTNSSDYKSIKENGKEISSPESFLRDIFTDMQLNPVEFINMSNQEQNRAILDLIEFKWDLNWIKEQFGEIPNGVDYSKNILQVLEEIQSEKGEYFLKRQDVNREIRNKNAFIEDIAKDIPEKYNAKKWESFDLTSKLKELMTIKENNNKINEAKQFIESYDNRIRGYQADRDIAISAEEKNINVTRENLMNENAKLQEQIKINLEKLSNLDNTLKDKINIIELEYENKIAKLDESIKNAKEYSEMEIQDVSELQEECDVAEKMKKHLNEYNRMENMKIEIEDLKNISEEYTKKIELARNLPAEILKVAKLPIEGLSVENGLALINGKPVSNLSEGEQLMLCVDVALCKENNLKLILLDGVEKLSTENRNKLYEKCKERGLQFIATRTDDSDELIVTEF